MTDIVFALVAAAAVAAYVCRLDVLTWRREPGLTLAHIAGALAAAWVVKVGALGVVQPVHALVLAGSVALLVLLWRHMPCVPRKQAGAPAPVSKESLSRVSGGAKPPEPRP